MSNTGVMVHASFKDRFRFASRLIKSAGMFAITGLWEGNERDRRRRRPPARKVAQDTDLDYGVREDLMAEARALAQVFGIVNRIKRQYANYVVGSCKVKWNTPDNAWNDAAEEQFNNHAQNIDLTGRHTLKQLARLGVKCQIGDGDIFFREIDEDDFYFLEAIEGDRVGNYRGSSNNVDEEKIVGGVLLDAINRPRAYRVHDRDRHGNFKHRGDHPANEMIHLFDPDRVDAFRGVTAFHCALNRLRDLHETIQAAAGQQKLASKLALIFKGGPGAGINVPGIPNAFGSDTNELGSTITTEEISDLAIQYLPTGGDVTAFHADVPSDSWFKLTELLIREIAIGLDLPFEFVWNMAGLTGPGTRMMSKQAERTFTNQQDNIETRFLNRVAGRWVTKEMEAGRLPFNAEWHWFKFPRPAHPSIDAGRESQSNLNELDSAVITGQEIAEERAADIYDIHAQKEREADDKLERAKRLSEKHDVPMELALRMIGIGTHVQWTEEKEEEPDDKRFPGQRPREEATAQTFNLNMELNPTIAAPASARAVVKRTADGYLIDRK